MLVTGEPPRRLAASHPLAGSLSVIALALLASAPALGRSMPSRSAESGGKKSFGAVDSPKLRRQQRSPALDSPPSHIVLSNTALPAARGQLRWRSSDVVLHEVEFGLTDRVQIGARALLPLIYVGVFPAVTVAARIGKHLHGALQLTGGVFWPYAQVTALENFFSGRFALWGGGPILTYRQGRLTLNAGLPIYGVSFGQKQFQTRLQGLKPINLSRTYFESWLLAIPNAGLIWKVSRRVRLNAEVHAPLGGIGDGRLWLLLYGARVSGKNAYLDVSFLLPATPGAEDLLRYIPVGIPLISTGMNF